ncbi:hypothetical protein ACX0HA_04715 [Flavobacterium hauense]
MRHKQSSINLIFSIVTLLLTAASCKTINTVRPDRVEIEFNDITLQLNDSLVNDFMNDFNQGKKKEVPANMKIVHTFDLRIYYKNRTDHYMSDGVYFINDSTLVRSKTDLFLKYWDLDEERIRATGKLIEVSN